MRKLKYFLPVLVVGVIVAIAATTSVQADKAENNTIADRVYIGEVAVGGMTAEEAAEAVGDYVDDLADDVVTLTAGEYSVETTVQELGLTWEEETVRVTEAVNLGKTGNLIERYKIKKDLENQDIVLPLVLNADETKANAFVQEHKDELNNEAVDFGLKRENGQFVVTGGTEGVELVEAECVNAINEFLATGWTDKPSIELPSEVTTPKGSEEELAKVQDQLGTFSTSYAGSAWGRKKNVEHGSAFIDGTIVYPGEEFSVVDTIGPITLANGYAEGGAYENGELVQSVGGGVCQISTTLYNAAIRAEMEITERAAHSMTVDYVKPSEDAAIAGTYKNLRFVNNTEAPIYIEAISTGSKLTFTIYGEDTRPANRTIEFISETTGTKATTNKFKATDAPVGTVTKTSNAHVGKTARLWKVVYIDGKEVSREIFNTSNYISGPAIYEVGTASAVPEATAAMNAAIASNDLATIQAAAAQWKDAKVEPETPTEPTTPTTPTTPTDPSTGSTGTTGDSTTTTQ